MRKSGLFATVLAAAAALVGVNTTATDAPGSAYIAAANSASAQTTGTKTPPAAPGANVAETQALKAGAIDIPVFFKYRATTRWAWVGRKVNGRFGYYCKPAGVRNG